MSAPYSSNFLSFFRSFLMLSVAIGSMPLVASRVQAQPVDRGLNAELRQNSSVDGNVTSQPNHFSAQLAKKKRKVPACRDRKDNDRDGKIDYPRDRGCSSRNDTTETMPPRRSSAAKSSSRGASSSSAGHVSSASGSSSSAGGGNAPVGDGASLQGRRPFPDNNPWNQDISGMPVDPNSNNLIASIGVTRGMHADFGTFWENAPIGIPYTVVRGSQPRVPVAFEYADESDTGPYPIPANPPIEGGPNSFGDRHVLMVDIDNWMLYELYSVYRTTSGGWRAGSGAIFNLNSNALRPAGWTSADAAGLPIFPGLVRYDEVMELGEIRHALRFTIQRSRRAYVYPATHFASTQTDPNLPPMGMRVRLKASVDISRFSAPVQVILRALKKYGMMVADNGSNWYISGAHDPRWNDDQLSGISGITGGDFEVVQMGEIITH